VFAWASELKAIRAFFRPEQLRLDETALYDALTYRYVPSPKSLYRGVWKALPGQLITFSLVEGHLAHRSYWRLEPGTLPACHGLSDDVWKALAARGQAEDVHCRQNCRDVVSLTKKPCRPSSEFRTMAVANPDKRAVARIVQAVVFENSVNDVRLRRRLHSTRGRPINGAAASPASAA
jgi:hypothetical protein